MNKKNKIEEILSKLPEEDRKEMREHLKQQRANIIRGAVVKVAARNFSHGVGAHVKTTLKNTG